MIRDDATATAKRLGRMLGITERRVHQLTNEGVFAREGRGAYPLDISVQAYVEHVRQTETAKVEAAPTPKARLEAEKARKAARENDEAENKLLPTEGAEVVLDLVIGTIRTGLSGVSAGVTDDITLREAIDGRLDAVLHDASETLAKAGGALREGGDPLKAV